MTRNVYRILVSCLFLLCASSLVMADSNDDAGVSQASSSSSDSKPGDTKDDDTKTSAVPASDKSIESDPEKSGSGEQQENTQSSASSDTTPDESKEKNTAVLKVVVIQIGEEKLPIKDARVIITYGDATEFERKTDASGMAMMTGLPYGKVDVDVTSSGRQSDGGTLLLDEPKKTLTFYLKPRTVSNELND